MCVLKQLHGGVSTSFTMELHNTDTQCLQRERGKWERFELSIRNNIFPYLVGRRFRVETKPDRDQITYVE